MGLREALNNKDFIITVEVAPPKGIDLSHLRKNLRPLKGRVDAINITDFQGASVRMSALSAALMVMEEGFEPMLHITGRDRNRIAIQGEVISAASIGIKNFLALTGDHPALGDNPAAKPVFDLDSVGILQAIAKLSTGRDMNNNKIDTPLNLFAGAVANPNYTPQELQIITMKKKIKAGARFFQTQAVFEIHKWKSFIGLMQRFGIKTKILAGIIPVRSVRMATFMNEHIPGIIVPEYVIKRVANANNPLQEGFKIAAETIKAIREEHIADGIHIMPIASLSKLPLLLDMIDI